MIYVYIYIYIFYIPLKYLCGQLLLCEFFSVSNFVISVIFGDDLPLFIVVAVALSVMAGLAPDGSQFDARQYDAKMNEL